MNELQNGATLPSQATIDKMRAYATKFAAKTGTSMHPDASITDTVLVGLSNNVEKLGRPLCPCNFYPDKKEEIKNRRWICACDEMQIFKYCHCLLFVNAEGKPITEYLPEDHEGRRAYGLVKDPTPDKGRALRDQADRAVSEMVDGGAGRTTPIASQLYQISGITEPKRES